MIKNVVRCHHHPHVSVSNIDFLWQNMWLYSRLRWVDNVKGRNSCLLCSTFAAHTHKQQTSHKTRDKKMKVDATLSNITSAFPQLLGHTGTLTTLVITTDLLPHSRLRVSDLALCLKSCLCLLISPVLRHCGQYRKSGPCLSLLTLLIPVRPGLPSPSVSSHAYPALTSTDRASHHPDQGTGLRHTRLLHPRRTYTRMHMYLIPISI